MFKKTFTRAALAVTLFTAVFCGSCNQKRPNFAAVTEEPTALEAQKLKKITEETQQYLVGKHICVVLGYGYNDEAFVEKTRAMLTRDYGVVSEGEDGLILLYVFPDDFDVGGRPRISKLTALLEDTTLAGLVVLGAPEGMAIPLAKLQDATDEAHFYPVFTLFPQDDVLASEATADFVLDYAHPSDVNAEGVHEEAAAVQDFDADVLIANAIQSMLTLRAPLRQTTSTQELLHFVQNIVGTQRTIIHYTDIESGIPSANHFIFQ